MSFVRLLPDHKGLTPLCSPPMNIGGFRRLHYMGDVERELLGCE
jgi:hypothetical protein